MKAMIAASHSIKPVIVSCLFWLATTVPSPARAVFEASLHTPLGEGNTAILSLGKFYLQVEVDTVDFLAILPPEGGWFSSDLEPVLSIPGVSLEFELGEGVPNEFHGLYTIYDHNPYLPFELPIQYDDEGNPYLIDAHVIRYADVYQGQFALPEGFLDDLLAGDGTVRFNDYIVGSIAPVAIPEPGAMGLALLALGGLWMVRGRTSRVPSDRAMLTSP